MIGATRLQRLRIHKRGRSEAVGFAQKRGCVCKDLGSKLRGKFPSTVHVGKYFVAWTADAADLQRIAVMPWSTVRRSPSLER